MFYLFVRIKSPNQYLGKNSVCISWVRVTFYLRQSPQCKGLHQKASGKKKIPSGWLNKQAFRRRSPQAGFHRGWGPDVSNLGALCILAWTGGSWSMKGWNSWVAGSVHRPENCFQLIASLRFTFITRIAACLSLFTAAMMEAIGVAGAGAKCFSFCVAENIHAEIDSVNFQIGKWARALGQSLTLDYSLTRLKHVLI